MTLTRAEVLEARRNDRMRRQRSPAFVPERKGHAARLIRWATRPKVEPVLHPPRKEEAPCCQRRARELGHLAFGCCSAECLRRPANWALHLAGEPIPPGGALDWRQPGPTQGAP